MAYFKTLSFLQPQPVSSFLYVALEAVNQVIVEGAI